MERLNKYHVIKTRDVFKYLSSEDQEKLGDIIANIQIGREKEGKGSYKPYCVVACTLPFYEETWKKIEEFVDAKDANSKPSKGVDLDENGKPKYYEEK